MEDLHLEASSSSPSSFSFSGNDDDSSASSSASYADESILLCTLPDSSAASSCSGAPGAASSVDPGVTGYGADIGLEPRKEEVAAAVGRQQTLETLSSDVAPQDLGFCKVKRSRVSLSGNLEGNLDVGGGKDEKFLDQSLEIRKKSRGNSTPNQKKEKIRSGNSEQNLAVEAKDSSREESMEKILQDIYTAPRSSPVCRKLPTSICKLSSEKEEEEEEEQESTSSESEISIRSPPRGADSRYPNNLQEAIEMLSKNFEHFDDKLNDMDILEIVSMRGVVFPISDWWPPRGYSKP